MAPIEKVQATRNNEIDKARSSAPFKFSSGLGRTTMSTTTVTVQLQQPVEVTGDGVSSGKQVKIISKLLGPWVFPFFLVGCASLALNGSIYVWPQYTSQLRDKYGLSESQVVLLGVTSQASMGILQLPFHLLNQWLSTRYQAVSVDRILCIVSGGMLTGGTLLMGAAFTSSSPPTGYLFFLMILYGAGTGNTYVHIMNVVNFQLMASQSLRRLAVAQLSVMLGAGGALFSMFYHFFLAKYSLSTTFFVLGALQALTFLLRYVFLVRDKSSIKYFVEEEELQDPDFSAQRGRVNVSHISWQDYSRSRIVWLTCLCTSFGLAVSSVWLSSLGNMAIYLGGASQAFMLTLVFLVMQTAGRLASALIYAWNENPYVMTLWQLCLLSGVVVVVIELSISTLYVATTMVALAFGGIWSAAPVITATSFPGDPSLDFIRGLAYVYIAITLVSLAVGQVQNVLVDMGNWTSVTTNRAYLAPFILFLAVAFMVVLLSILLAYFIKRKKREGATSGIRLNALTSASQVAQL